MSLWLEEKYLRLVSPQLEHFKPKQDHTYNFRCPLCGDSESRRNIARGYIFPVEQKLLFKCHNCNLSLPFVALLRKLSPGIYNDYLMETLEDRRPPQTVREAPQQPAPTRIPNAAALSPLSDHRAPESPLHPVWLYARRRGIPFDSLSRLSATNKARTWLLPLVGMEKASALKDGVDYLVIPLKLPTGEWYGAQVRDITQKIYLTYRWSRDPLKVFGLDAWDPKRTTYILEGPMDALFIPNALASCGADLLGTARILEDEGLMSPDTERVFVWDNEPRSFAVTAQMRKAINGGESVVIWPKDAFKDVNDRVLAGFPLEDIIETMHERTFMSIHADLAFADWQKTSR